MIYLDNSSTTKQAPEVTAKMMEMMEVDFGNPSSLHRMGMNAEKALKDARRQILSGFLGEGSVAFVSGGTEGDNMAVFGAARAARRRGRRIVTTAVEHPAVLECCEQLEKNGFEVVRVGVDRQCRINIKELEDAIDESTILVSMMQVNNEVGTVMPVEETLEIMRRKSPKALLHCDAVQGFGKIATPAGADLIVISGHKIHGPKGSGAVWIRKGVNLPELSHGGGQEKGLRSGTENVPAIAGLGVAAELAGKRMEKDFDHVSGLRNKLLDGLTNEIDDVVINSPEETGSSPGMGSPYILNVSFAGTRGEVILHTLEQDGIYVSTGSACSSNKKGRSHVLAAMGLSDSETEGAIRFSMCAENTIEEIEETVDKTAKAVKRFRQLGSFR